MKISFWSVLILSNIKVQNFRKIKINNTGNLKENQQNDDDYDSNCSPGTFLLNNDRMHLRPKIEFNKLSRYHDFEVSFISKTGVEEPATYEETIKYSKPPPIQIQTIKSS